MELRIREIQVAAPDFTIVQTKEIEPEKAIQTENVLMEEILEAETISVENAENIQQTMKLSPAAAVVAAAAAEEMAMYRETTEQQAPTALQFLQIAQEKTAEYSFRELELATVTSVEKTAEIGMTHTDLCTQIFFFHKQLQVVKSNSNFVF